MEYIRADATRGVKKKKEREGVKRGVESIAILKEIKSISYQSVRLYNKYLDIGASDRAII